MTTEEKLEALKQAWLDVPFHGVLPAGWGEPLQNLINAASDIVDPERTLRDTDEAKRRGGIAGYRQRHAYALDQIGACDEVAEKEGVDLAASRAKWIAKRDEEAAACLAEFGVVL